MEPTEAGVYSDCLVVGNQAIPNVKCSTDVWFQTNRAMLHH